jgi:hypothetical protein
VLRLLPRFDTSMNRSFTAGHKTIIDGSASAHNASLDLLFIRKRLGRGYVAGLVPNNKA